MTSWHKLESNCYPSTIQCFLMCAEHKFEILYVEKRLNFKNNFPLDLPIACKNDIVHLQITEILKKPEEDRTIEDRKLLELSPDVAKDILKRSKSRELARERKLEVDDLFSRVEPVNEPLH